MIQKKSTNGYILSTFTSCSLEYKPNTAGFYQRLSHLPGFALLQSGDKYRGRYDIITAYPHDQFSVSRDSSRIGQAFEDFKSSLPSKAFNGDHPFQGGAIGYISYDLGAIQSGIYSKAHTVIDDLPLLNMHFYDWAIIIDHHLSKVDIVAAHRCASTKAIIEEIIHLWDTGQDFNDNFKCLTDFNPLVDWDEYQTSFEAIHRDLMWGRAYQVNYALPFVAEYEGDPWHAYHAISQANPVPYSAFLRFNDFDVLSFSPERLLLHDDGQLFTSPIKGSSPRAKDTDTDNALKASLKSSAKNKAENIMIVDLLRNDLGKVAETGSVQVDALCEIQSFSQVHHLVSHIKARLKDGLSPIDTLAALFPGGSITGAPKLEAMKIIDEHELYARGVYCGSIGYFSNHGRFDTSITIRTMLAKANHLYLQAGGGIVVDSNPEDEYHECYTKIKAIIKNLECYKHTLTVA
jgi:para-aminobenzoate synthetase component I